MIVFKVRSVNRRQEELQSWLYDKNAQFSPKHLQNGGKTMNCFPSATSLSQLRFDYATFGKRFDETLALVISPNICGTSSGIKS